MFPRAATPPSALELARHQAGVISRAQLLELGLSRRAIDRLSGGWSRVVRGVYLIGPLFGEVPWLARVWAGLLLGGSGARAGMFTAAILDRLASPGELVRGHDVGDEHQVTIFVGGRPMPQPGFTFLREERGLRLPSSAREPARTRIEDTVLDLCSAGDAEAVVTWVTRACQRRLTSARRLRDRLAERPRLRHRALILEMVTDAGLGVTSHLEHRAIRTVFRAHGLPAPELQYRTGSSGRIADAAYPRLRILIEFDGRLGHVEEGGFRDLRRDNDHTLDGWVTLRFGWADVAADPCAVAAQIARLLAAHGWAGVPTPCLGCARTR